VRAKGREVRSRFLDRPLYAGTTIPAERRFPVNLSKTRVKVPRTTLIERIEEHIVEAEKQLAESEAKYQKELDEFMAKLPGVIDKKVKELLALEPKEALNQLRGGYRNRIIIDFDLRMPEFDSGGDEYSYIDRRSGYQYHGIKGFIKELKKSKRVLEASTEDTISVSATDQYADWL